MKFKLLVLAIAGLLAATLAGCDSDKNDETKAVEQSAGEQGTSNTELLSDEELQKKIQDRR